MDNQDEKIIELKNKNTRTINGTSWVVLATAQNLETNQKFMLLQENILTLQFKNSIQLPVPELTLLYRDDTFDFSHFLRINGLKISLSIISERFTKDLSTIYYDDEYILSDFEITAHKKDYNIYTLKCKQIDFLKLIQNVNYSTNKQTLVGQVSPYKIIEDVNKIVQNSFDNRYVETTRRIDFISSQNSSAIEIINYCLKMRC